MKVEVITIGDEILSGNIVDTNFAWLGDRLWGAGYDLHWHSTVGDEPDKIRSVLVDATGRSDVAVVTGGLGPTIDDITIEVAAQAFGLPLELNSQALSDIRTFFEKFRKGSLTRPKAVEGEAPSGFAHGGRQVEARLRRAVSRRRTEHNDASPSNDMTPNNEKQAFLLAGSQIIRNTVGTAPGCHVIFRKTHFFFLPGVPREMKQQFEDGVLPAIRSIDPQKRVFAQKRLRCFGAPEATIDQKLAGMNLEGIDLAFRASFPEIFLKISARGSKEEAFEKRISEVEAEIRSRLGDLVYGEGDETLPAVVGRMLADRHETLAVAESCTGGYLASLITDVPGSSLYFERGVVTYSNNAKKELLHVPNSILEIFGAVSSETAAAMAKGIRKTAQTSYGLGITGIAGPDGGTREKPVGTVHMALDAKGDLETRELHLPTSREWFKRLAAFAALDLLRKKLATHNKGARP